MAAVNNAINDKVGGSNSGVTNTLTVDNASNTASSSALVNVTVGGTTASDAFQTFTVSGTTNWSIGTDNSVTGDPLVIAGSTALGTTNIMSALTTGEINYPLLPAFLTTLSGALLNKTGDGTSYTIVFDSEVFDQGSDLSGATFTAPVTGRYFLSVATSVSGITGLMTSGLWRIATSNRTYVYLAITHLGTAGGGVDAASGVCLADMDAADTATSVVQISGGALVVDIDAVTTFSGRLVA